MNSRTRDAILARWLDRPAEQKGARHTIPFIDDMWDSQLRLARTPHNHYQEAMGLIRPFIQ